MQVNRVLLTYFDRLLLLSHSMFFSGARDFDSPALKNHCFIFRYSYRKQGKSTGALTVIPDKRLDELAKA